MPELGNTLMRKRFIAITCGAAAWVAAVTFGQALVIVTGIPALSAVINGLIVPFILVLTALSVNYRWSVTYAFTVYGLLTIPTLLLGPPGPHKILVALVAGLVTDLILLLLRRFPDYIRFSVAFLVWGALLAGLARLCYELLPLPGKEKFLAVFLKLTMIFIVEAVIGSILAVRIFRKKLYKHPLIIRLSATQDDKQEKAVSQQEDKQEN